MFFLLVVNDFVCASKTEIKDALLQINDELSVYLNKHHSSFNDNFFNLQIILNPLPTDYQLIKLK